MHRRGPERPRLAAADRRYEPHSFSQFGRVTRADGCGLGVVLTGGTSEAGQGYGVEDLIDLTNVDVRGRRPVLPVEAEGSGPCSFGHDTSTRGAKRLR